MEKVKIEYIDVLTPLGRGCLRLFSALLSGQSAVLPNSRFDCRAFRSENAALIPEITRCLAENDKSCLEQMFDILLDGPYFSPLGKNRTMGIPEDARLIFASTVGEIDILERALINSSEKATIGKEDAALLKTASRLGERLGITKPAYVVSAACASASAAVGRATSLIGSGEERTVVVVSADCVSEFVFSGFSALMALDGQAARPFDAERNGLTAGEAAGIIVLTSEDESQSEPSSIEEKLPNEDHTVIEAAPNEAFFITGSGFSSDANHMTGPSRDGSGLARAVRQAVANAGLSPRDIGFIAAHGTGTRYNDAMEMKAYKSLFPTPCPLYSIKGAVGHTMGNAGLLQISTAVQAMKHGGIPPTVGLTTVAKDAVAWASSAPVDIAGDHALVVNAGFGGINSALVISRGKDD